MGQKAKQDHSCSKIRYLFTLAPTAIPSYYVSRDRAPRADYQALCNETAPSHGWAVPRTNCKRKHKQHNHKHHHINELFAHERFCSFIKLFRTSGSLFRREFIESREFEEDLEDSKNYKTDNT